MTATERLPNDTVELDALLTQHGQKHRVWPSGLVIWHDERTVYEYEPAKNHHDEYWGGILRMTMRHLTPEQAIAATLGQEDSYTREEVESAFVDGYSIGCLPVGSDPRWDQNRQTVEEHMAELGWERSRGTCEVECFDDGVDEGLDGEWYSYSPPTWHLSCGHTCVGSERPSWCPTCGKRVTS